MVSRPSLTLFSGLVVRKAFDDVIIDAFGQASGIDLNCVFDPTVKLLARIAEGEPFDVMIGTTGSFEDLGRRGVVDPDSVTPFVRTGIGLGVKQGDPLPDISTVAALTEAVRQARSVAYSRTGQSGIYFVELVEQLGIAEEVLSRATVLEKGFTANALMDGSADLAVQQVSELLFVPNTAVVGFLPDEVQRYTEFACAISTGSEVPEAGRVFIDFISGETAAAAYRETFLEPISRR